MAVSVVVHTRDSSKSELETYLQQVGYTSPAYVPSTLYTYIIIRCGVEETT